MMTMHSAKGLEFDTVFIVGAEEGLFPGIRAIGNQLELEEERRLCYVAMTRAMRRLYFICARQRMLFGKTSAAQSSRFVREISNENIDIHEPFSHLGSFGFGSPDNSGDTLPSPANPNSESRIPNSKFRSPNSEFQIPNSKFQSPNSESRIPNSEFKKGDMVNHTAHGRGIITSIKPVGGDALLEIAFDSEGTKRFMLKYVMRYLTKEK